MNNERIDEILKENILFFHENENMQPHYSGLIRKAMEQYGKEMYESGRASGTRDERIKHDGRLNFIKSKQ